LRKTAPHEPIRLEKCVPEKNQQRFYLLRLAPTLFGEWSLIREWGRIGQPGRIVLDTFVTSNEAEAALEAKKAEKQRRGYYLCS
jgi:predicted DNA-binding WGR domain protein